MPTVARLLGGVLEFAYTPGEAPLQGFLIPDDPDSACRRRVVRPGQIQLSDIS
jgi:hypothetical protein